VRKHFEGTLARLDQPDTMSLQLQYLRRTRVGHGIVSIKDLKLGGTVSTIQATLSQDGRDEVQGYITQTNFSKQEGLNLPTSFTSSGISPAPAPIDFSQVKQTGEDDNWRVLPDPPNSDFRRAMQHIVFCLPKQKPDPSYVEQWARFRPGGLSQEIVPFPQEALGFIADMFPLIVEQYALPSHEKRELRWYPTVALNLDIKRRLPPGGAEWLYVRVRTAEIRNGRMDLQVVVLDQERNVVALSSHINLVLSASRNLADRTPVNGESLQAEESSRKERL
jgi:hypothetical protein